MELKWIVRSRALAAFWMPIVGLVVGQYAPEQSAEIMEQAQTLVDNLIASADKLLIGAGAAMALWHKLRPDGASNTLLPQVRTE